MPRQSRDLHKFQYRTIAKRIDYWGSNPCHHLSFAWKNPLFCSTLAFSWGTTRSLQGRQTLRCAECLFLTKRRYRLSNWIHKCSPIHAHSTSSSKRSLNFECFGLDSAHRGWSRCNPQERCLCRTEWGKICNQISLLQRSEQERLLLWIVKTSVVSS